uniref:Uncharacterized protein n=1 Tax=Anguilla anguilla TaxID=7936 RepID=A0A0E9XRF9_ANGAN
MSSVVLYVHFNTRKFHQKLVVSNPCVKCAYYVKCTLIVHCRLQTVCFFQR